MPRKFLIYFTSLMADGRLAGAVSWWWVEWVTLGGIAHSLVYNPGSWNLVPHARSSAIFGKCCIDVLLLIKIGQ